VTEQEACVSKVLSVKEQSNYLRLSFAASGISQNERKKFIYLFSLDFGSTVKCSTFFYALLPRSLHVNSISLHHRHGTTTHAAEMAINGH
jgi:hypothetical protein